ncbi:MAG: Wzz/FepE/Etk N-terminal domain-containing protein, partial [Actinomycetota bacterium]|nr:Wzz/FepE/Etk N-terminal domain-containing protein [Actinomycetota bacterium]
MSTGSRRTEGSNLQHYLGILRRRLPVILITATVVLVVSLAVSFSQATVYSASAEVLINRNNLAETLSTTQLPYTDAQTAARLIDTQVQLARVPSLAGNVIAANGLSEPTGKFLESSSVQVKETTDLLVFSVKRSSSALARKLATSYADQFTRYRRDLDATELEAVSKNIQAQLAPLQTTDGQTTPLYASLQDKLRQVQTLQAVQSSSAVLVRPADSGEKVQPKPVTMAAGGLLLGLLLGIGLAILLETLDTRMRSSTEIGERLELPLLARLPEPPPEFLGSQRLVTLEADETEAAEPFH